MAAAISGRRGRTWRVAQHRAQLDESAGVTQQAGRTELAVRDMRDAGRGMLPGCVSEKPMRAGRRARKRHEWVPAGADRCHREHSGSLLVLRRHSLFVLRGEPCSQVQHYCKPVRRAAKRRGGLLGQIRPKVPSAVLQWGELGEAFVGTLAPQMCRTVITGARPSWI